MDNPAAAIPSTPPQPAVQPTVSFLTESPSRRWLLWLAGGLTILIFGIAIGIFSAKFLNQSQSPRGKFLNQSQNQPQSQNLPLVSSPTSELVKPTFVPTADTATGWKTYTNSKYSFSFKHPNFDEECCGLAGAVSDNPTAVITLADITTTMPGTDAPFDGLAAYIIPNQNSLTLDQYIEKEKAALFRQFKAMADSNMVHEGRVINTKIAGQPAVSLIDYSWDGITRTYFKHPNSAVIIEISKSEQSPDHFSSYDQILSTFHFLK